MYSNWPLGVSVVDGVNTAVPPLPFLRFFLPVPAVPAVPVVPVVPVVVPCFVVPLRFLPVLAVPAMPAVLVPVVTVTATAVPVSVPATCPSRSSLSVVSLSSSAGTMV